MPTFTYVGDPDRTYTTLPAPANRPEYGEDYELADDPGDGRWAKKATKKAAAAKEAAK